jgi:hypothetical protein
MTALSPQAGLGSTGLAGSKRQRTGPHHHHHHQQQQQQRGPRLSLDGGGDVHAAGQRTHRQQLSSAPGRQDQQDQQRQQQQPGKAQESKPAMGAPVAGWPAAAGSARARRGGGGTRFDELLGAGGGGGAAGGDLRSREAFLADLRLQQQLAKKLKLKKVSGRESGAGAGGAGFSCRVRDRHRCALAARAAVGAAGACWRLCGSLKETHTVWCLRVSRPLPPGRAPPNPVAG